MCCFAFYNPLLCLRVSFVTCRAITLDNQLVLLATTAADAGRYHVEAVNEMTGENVTSAAVYLSVSGETILPIFRKARGKQRANGNGDIYSASQTQMSLPHAQIKGVYSIITLLIVDYKIFSCCEKWLHAHYLIYFTFCNLLGGLTGLPVSYNPLY